MTLTFGVPAMLLFVSQHPDFDGADLSSLRLVVCGGAPVPEPLIKLYNGRGIPINQGYGLTETAPFVTFLTPEFALAKSARPARRRCSPRSASSTPTVTSSASRWPSGEVCVKGPNVMKGYWNRPDATAAAIDPEGWFHTGDIGYLDEDGFLYIADRVKDMVITGGENVYPAEVESVLYDHPAIAEVAVIGLPDERWGEAVVAVAALRPGSSAHHRGAPHVRRRTAGPLQAADPPRARRHPAPQPGRQGAEVRAPGPLPVRFGPAGVALALAAGCLAPAASPAGAAPAPSLFMVADSVGLSAKDAIPAAFAGWNVTITGRPAVFTDVAVDDYVAPSGPLPDIAVVATGYNYPFWDPGRFDRSVDAMVDTLVAKGAHHVIWVTLREVKPQYISASAWAQIQPYYWYFPEVNAHLRAARARHPELSLADWAAVADATGLTYDAIHLNTAGAARYARLLRTEVDGIGRVPGGQTLEVPVTGVSGVPADAAAVVLNVTATDPKYAGYLTVHPCGEPAPTASNLNYEWDTTVANHVVVKPGAGGKVCVFTYADAHVVVDLDGWIPAGAGGFTGVTPTRAFDSRAGPTPGAGATVTVPLRPAGVPASASAAVLNVTAVDPSAPGYLSVSPCPGAAGPVSSVNYGPGQTVADLAVTPLGSGGTVCVQTSAASHVVVDVMGWFGTGSAFAPVAPHRVVDTRQGLGAPARPVAGGSVLDVDLPAVGGVPAGASAAALTVTVTGATAAGYATVFPCGAPAPLASDLDYEAGTAVPALTLAALPASGHVCIFTYASADVVVDLSGWVAAGGGYVGVTPTRLVDTRSDEAHTT